MTLLHKIISTGSGKRYYRITNADDKSWLLPARNMRVALNLYQPSRRNGKLLKALFPWLHRLPIVRKAIKAETICCTLQDELKELLQRMFNCKDLEFAIFEGTPSVHQKMTIQLSCGNKILGYCKASDNKEIMQLFEKEAATLTLLAQKGVKNIPQVLFCGTLSNGVSLFVQSTIKSHSSKMTHRWGALQENFLATLHESTKQAILFEESDFYNAITTLREHIDWLPSTADKEAVAKAVETILNKHKGKVVEYSTYHADFTPWNMFVEKGELFVFDFEYSALTYPPGLDRYHFELQTAVFENTLNNKEIIRLFTDKTKNLNEKDKFIEYLVSIIALYTMREKGIYNEELEKRFDLWTQLIKKQIHN